MKISRFPTAFLCATALALSGVTLHAVPSNPTFSFYENGQGILELPNGVVIPIPGALASDAGPGGLSSALTFTTHPQEEFFVPGDLLLLDANGRISDVLRFNTGTAADVGLTQLLVFYSNDSGGLLADTGLPTAFYPNTFVISEKHSGPTIYTPIAGQPGFEAGFPLPITYQIFSTPDVGSTLSLFGMGVFAIALLRRKLPVATEPAK